MSERRDSTQRKPVLVIHGGAWAMPDDAVAARFTLLLGKQGNVRTQSLKAFPEEAYRQIVNTLR